MTRASLVVCLVLAGIAGCATTDVGFGPFPTSGIGGTQLTAGVAGFIPNTIPGEGEFALLIANTDSTSSHIVTVTPEGGSAVDRTIEPCNVGTVAVPCDAETVLVELTVAGSATPITLTITPVPETCTQRFVYIGVTGTTGTGGGGTDTPDTVTLTLTESLPTSAAACGLGGLPDLSDLTD